ncbi:hypothetical protein [Streptomyces sp. NPDC004721]
MKDARRPDAGQLDAHAYDKAGHPHKESDSLRPGQPYIATL